MKIEYGTKLNINNQDFQVSEMTYHTDAYGKSIKLVLRDPGLFQKLLSDKLVDVRDKTYQSIITEIDAKIAQMSLEEIDFDEDDDDDGGVPVNK